MFHPSGRAGRWSVWGAAWAVAMSGGMSGALSGCQMSFGGKDDTALTDDSGGGGGGDDTGGGKTGTNEGVPGLADIRDEMDRSAGDCQELQGDALPGANSYFWGEYEGNAAEGWFGTEKFYVFANDTLKDQGGEDCEVTWIVTAGQTSPGSCSGCEVGLDVSATMDGSTCGDGMADEANFTITYAVDQLSDGTSRWFFASSGTDLGQGYWNEDGMNYLTDSSCRWF